MSLLGRVQQGAAQRSTLSNPSEDLIAAFGGGNKTYSGKTVTVAGALALIPVFRAVTLLSGAVGALPLEVYRRAGGEKQLASPTSRPWQLLHDKPNERMAADEVWSMVEAHLLTWGNAFLWKERGRDGRIANLWPLDPSRVQVGLDKNSRPIFQIRTFGPTAPGSTEISTSGTVTLGPDEILHIRGLSSDGLVGYSPIQLARQALGGMLAQEEFEGRFWANDATPGVVLIHPNKLTPEATNRLKALWDNRHKGPNKARSTAVLGEAVAVQNMTMPLEDAQFVDIAKLRRTDVALLFGLPPHMLAGEVGNSFTYSNTEYASVEFVKWSARPHMKRIEGSLTWDPDLMPTNWFAKFNADEILRGSMTERFDAYAKAPHLLVDEIREQEDMPPLPDGEGQKLSKSASPTPGDQQQQPGADQQGGTPAQPTPKGTPSD